MTKHIPLALSALFGLGSVVAVLLRFGYPNQGYIGLGLYVVGWALFVVALHRYRVAREQAAAAQGFIARHRRTLGVAAALSALGYLLYVLFPARVTFLDLSAAELDAVLARDARAVAGLVESQPWGWDSELAQRRFTELDETERKRLVGSWAALVDRTLSLETLVDRHRRFYQIDYRRYPTENLRSFLLGYAALLAQTRAGYALRSDTQKNPGLRTVLDEPRAHWGIPAGACTRMERGLLAPETAILFHAGRAHLEFAKRSGKLGRADDLRLMAYCERTYQELFATVGKQPSLWLSSSLDLYQDTTVKLWFPLQRGISEAMGDLRTTRRPMLITEQQAHDARADLEPGDLVLERHNWYLSNLGLPGFWPHAALYTGDLADLDRYFQGLDELGGRPFSVYLSEKYPDVRARYRPAGTGRAPSLLEAVSEGVVLTEFEVSGAADYLAVLRPRLDRREIFGALLRAYAFLGRPYDFDFDFLTDSSLVCSEVVYKAYRPANGRHGLSFETELTAGRVVVSPTAIARQFARDYGTPAQQLDFVLFLDGIEAEKRAVSRDVQAFRQSATRPKWDMMQD